VSLVGEVFRKRAAVATVMTVGLLGPALHAQWIKVTLPDTPRNADGTTNLSAPTPRADDGKPDLSGIWRIDTRLFRPRLLPRDGGGPNRLEYVMPEGAVIPLQAGADAVYRERAERLGQGAPASRCLPHGAPANMISGPMKIVQTRRLTLFLFEEFNHYRQVFIDGRSFPDGDPQLTWFGYSLGRWEGETFVVETVGFNDQAWMDDAGLPRSEALRTIERLQRRDYGHLDVSITFEDPKSYTRPWSIDLHFVLQADTELIEYICENERDAAHMVGK
jgi:hypothetical protein